MKKTRVAIVIALLIEMVGLGVLCVNHTSCSNLISVGITSDGTIFTPCVEGWYLWDDNINDPLYIYYNSDECVKRIGTFSDEIKGEKFNIAQKTFTFDNAAKNLSYFKNPDILLDLPLWTRDFILKDFVVKDGGTIDGFTLCNAINKESTYLAPCFVLQDKDSSVTFNTSYFAYQNDVYKPLVTKKPVGLYVTCEDETIKEYISVSNKECTDSLNLLYSPIDFVNGEVLSNNLTFTCIKKPTQPFVYHLEVRNKERGEDTFMFDLYLKL